MTGDDQMSQSVLLKLLGQLCRVYVEGSRIPDKVREIWSQCKDPSTKRVNVDELLSILVHVADDLDREVIVIFDGIDEVQSTANLDGIFRMIDSLLNHRRFRLLVSSRAVGYMEERQWPQRMLKIELSLETYDSMQSFINERLRSSFPGKHPLISQEQVTVLGDLLNRRCRTLLVTPLH